MDETHPEAPKTRTELVECCGITLGQEQQGLWPAVVEVKQQHSRHVLDWLSSLPAVAAVNVSSVHFLDEAAS